MTELVGRSAAGERGGWGRRIRAGRVQGRLPVQPVRLPVLLGGHPVFAQMAAQRGERPAALVTDQLLTVFDREQLTIGAKAPGTTPRACPPWTVRLGCPGTDPETA